MRASIRPAILAGVGVLAVLLATGITLKVHGTEGKAGATATASPANVTVCERVAVPAYFTAGYWETAIHSTPPPADIILNPSTGVGAGTAPNRQLQALVKQAQAAGITVLGYSSTINGTRPASEVEADVQHYAAWYGVHSIFLDRVSGQAAQLSYYKKLAAYIHQAYRGAQVWLNPGDYPDQSYMSIGDVVLVFEGAYENYVTAQVPGWIRHYPAAKFAQNIFATPKDVLLKTLETARQRRAGHIYVTDLVGSNPYLALPSYWTAENAEATADCPSG
jgi:hypothetical protein